jgi:GTP-sensing pleiotropic transcriptional regulator CodY
LSFVSNELVAKSFLQPVVSVNGKILESKTEKAIEINIFILNDKGKIIGESKNNKLDGSFFITGLKPGTAYELVFKSKKQTLKTMSIATPLTDKYLELNQDFYLKVQSSELQTLNK